MIPRRRRRRRLLTTTGAASRCSSRSSRGSSLRASRSLAVVLLLLTYISSSSYWCRSSKAQKTTTEQEDNPPVNNCQLWMAPSYLNHDIDEHDHENASPPIFGLFAGSTGFRENELLPSYEIAIPVVDLHNNPSTQRNEFTIALKEYLEKQMWISDIVGSKFEANNSLSVFIPGIGSLIQSHNSGYSNIDWFSPSVLLRTPDLPQVIRPGWSHASRGSISTYYNTSMRATTYIPPGMELFVRLGGDEENHEDDNDVHDDRINRQDYELADKILQRILDFFGTNNHPVNNNGKLENEILDFMFETILQEYDGKHAKIIRSLLPPRLDKLYAVKKYGGTFLYRHHFDMIHSEEWLSTNGLCVDTLMVQPSTMPDAGYGAFAKHAFDKGDIIMPVPMIPILDPIILDMYNETIQVETDVEDVYETQFDPNKPPIGKQVLWNYCYGHFESSLLLLPAAPMVNYINHAPDKSLVNAVLQWSQHDSITNDHQLQDTKLHQWDLDNLPPIMMTLMATRPIEAGEEIFIDYGDSWSNAWYNDYRTNRYRDDIPWPLRAIDVRNLYSDKPYPVDIKQGQIPYPPGIMTACFISATDDLPDGQPRKNLDSGLQIMQWLGPKTYVEYTGRHLTVCDLMSRQLVVVVDNDNANNNNVVTYNYTVITRLHDDAYVEIRNVPHKAITLIDRPYTSDLFTIGAFRHVIQIEDQRFPQAWRNLRHFVPKPET